MTTVPGVDVVRASEKKQGSLAFSNRPAQFMVGSLGQDADVSYSEDRPLSFYLTF